jgi:HAMP domain-containing protein
MSDRENLRKWANVVVDGRALIRLSVPFFVLLVVNLLTAYAISWKAYDLAYIDQSVDHDALLIFTRLSQSANVISMIGAAAVVLSGLVCLGAWLILSHRIFGPSVPIRRMIRELNEGNYSTRISLRKYDEFKELAADLNQLAETLEKHKSATG